jgi:hypothetical protein
MKSSRNIHTAYLIDNRHTKKTVRVAWKDELKYENADRSSGVGTEVPTNFNDGRVGRNM